jgi:DNA polymerase-3 subunit alpha
LQDNKSEEQRQINKQLSDISNRTGIPLVAVTDVFYEYPEAMSNISRITNRCNAFVAEELFECPPEDDLPEGFTTSVEYLLHLVMRGLEEKCPGKVNSYISQAVQELGTIKYFNYMDYFLIIADIIGWAREHDIPVDPKQGSDTASLINYALGITGIDLLNSVKYEPAAIEEGADVINYSDINIPNIDVYFSAADKNRILKYVIEKYGKNRVARISTRSIGEDGKKNIGLHPTGLVISRDKLDDYVPLYRDSQTGVIATQYSMPELEKRGLLIMNFPGLNILEQEGFNV